MCGSLPVPASQSAIGLDCTLVQSRLVHDRPATRSIGRFTSLPVYPGPLQCYRVSRRNDPPVPVGGGLGKTAEGAESRRASADVGGGRPQSGDGDPRIWSERETQIALRVHHHRHFKTIAIPNFKLLLSL